MELSARARTLRCVANGTVISLSELADGVYSRRLKGDGFAVKIKKRLVPPEGEGLWAGAKRMLISFIQPSEFVEVVAPADGVVTGADDCLSIRTGDGINVSVFTEIKAEFLPKVGEKVKRGAPILIAERKLLQQNTLSGAVAVLFTEPLQITELHVSTGRRRAGERTAYYKQQK